MVRFPNQRLAQLFDALQTETLPQDELAKRLSVSTRTVRADITALNVGQNLKVKAGNNAMDATVLEITKDGVRVQLTSGMSMIVRAEHLLF